MEVKYTCLVPRYLICSPIDPLKGALKTTVDLWECGHPVHKTMTHAEAYDTVSTHDGTVRQPRPGAFHRPGPRSPGIVRAIRFYHIVMFLLSLRRDTLRGTFVGRHDRAKTGGASSWAGLRLPVSSCMCHPSRRSSP